MFFFIVWGSQGRKTVLSNGVFQCPQCGPGAQFAHIQLDKYFTLFWIPLFKTQTLGQFVECQHCKQAWNMHVLNLRQLSPHEQMVQWFRQDLQSGTPIKMALRKAMAAGTAEEIARPALIEVCSQGAKQCPVCKSSFLPSIRQCVVCGQDLSAIAIIRFAPESMRDASKT